MLESLKPNDLLVSIADYFKHLREELSTSLKDLNAPSKEKNSSDRLDKELKVAKQEWKKANQYFNLVSDPELKEYAIYLLEATEKKYNYLLKKKKSKSE